LTGIREGVIVKKRVWRATPCPIYPTKRAKRKENMNSENDEVVPGLSSADVADMAEKIFNRTDGNHPQLDSSENGFLDILQNAKPAISASPAFIRKVVL
jgi:hypothetical protein